MLTPADINQKLQLYLQENRHSEPLRSHLAEEQRPFMIDIAQELIDALADESGRVVKKGSPIFSPYDKRSFGSNYGSRITPYLNKEIPKVHIGFGASEFKRDSFASAVGGDPVNRTGVYDIVGLFTKGYGPLDKSKWAYGFWDTHGEWTRSHSIGNAPGLAPNPFVSRVINAFWLKYNNVISDIQYPAEWH